MIMIKEFAKNVQYTLKRNVLVLLLIVFLCPLLSISYASFTINSSKYRSSEMYIGNLLYSISINNVPTSSFIALPGENDLIIEITSLNQYMSNYKIAFENNPNISVIYASDEFEPTFGLITTSKKSSILINNNSENNITVNFLVSGGYKNNDLSSIIIQDGYTSITDHYMKYDFETVAMYVDDVRVDSLDSEVTYGLISYSCTNNESVVWQKNTNKLSIYPILNSTKCQLYFEENPLDIVNSYSCLNGSAGTAPYNLEYTGNCSVSEDDDGNWKVKFTSTGYITLADQVKADIFLVGGGGGGGDGGEGWPGPGGGGGYAKTYLNETIMNIRQQIIIGAGGAHNRDGSASSAFGFSAAGGIRGGVTNLKGGDGGSGGGTGGGRGGSYGNNGASGRYAGGTGQYLATNQTTCEFNEGTTSGCFAGVLAYGGGGSGSGQPATDGGGGAGGSSNHDGQAGTDGLGGGGGGGDNSDPGYTPDGGRGGSGIVIIRNVRSSPMN